MRYVNFILLVTILLAVLTTGWYGTLRPCEILEERLVDLGLEGTMVQTKLSGKSELACLRAAFRSTAQTPVEDPEKLF